MIYAQSGAEFMEISKDAFKAANRQAADRSQNTPIATGARYDEHAKPHQLDKIEITPSGLGIHFPKLDADLYLPALLEGFLGSRRWIAAQMGRIGGKASTKAKSAAARRNGKLGGRPKKVIEPA